METRRKTFVIVGGTSGLGLATARLLVFAGHEVVVIGNVEEEVARTQAEFNCPGYVCNVANYEEVQTTFKRAFTEHGPVAGLVNCAAIWAPAGPYHELPVEVLQATTDVNLLGAMYVLKETITHMLDQEGGDRHVVLIGARASERPAPGVAAYAGQKSGVAQLGMSVGMHYGPQDILVSTLSPGAMKTDLQKRVGAEFLDKEGEYAEAEQVAKVVLFLLLNDTGLIITGLQVMAKGDRRW